MAKCRSLLRIPVPESNCIVPRRSEMGLPMEGLLVAVGAHPLTVREAYQLVFSAESVNRTGQLGRAIDARAIAGLTKLHARRREGEQQPIKKGASRRDQRDEQHPFYDDRTHCMNSPARQGALTFALTGRTTVLKVSPSQCSTQRLLQRGQLKGETSRAQRARRHPLAGEQ